MTFRLRVVFTIRMELRMQWPVQMRTQVNASFNFQLVSWFENHSMQDNASFSRKISQLKDSKKISFVFVWIICRRGKCAEVLTKNKENNVDCSNEPKLASTCNQIWAHLYCSKVDVRGRKSMQVGVQKKMQVHASQNLHLLAFSFEQGLIDARWVSIMFCFNRSFWLLAIIWMYNVMLVLEEQTLVKTSESWTTVNMWFQELLAEYLVSFLWAHLIKQ